MDPKERLIQLIKERSLRVSDREEFILASGLKSRYYIDMKKTAYSPEGLYLIGRLFYEKIRQLGLRSRFLGGLTLGADPIALATARYSYDMGDPIEAFVIRKEPKDHGTRGQIEGAVRPGESVIIVEDVVTTGGSTLKAIDVAEAEGLRVEAVLALIDREEANARERIQKKGIPFYSILTRREILDV